MQEYTNCHRTGKTPPKKKPFKPAETTPLTSPKTDPQGMYTGVPIDPNETPVQDADDL